MTNYYKLAATILRVAGDNPLPLGERVTYHQLWPGYGALQVDVPQKFVEFRADNVDQLAAALKRTVEEYGIPISFMVK